MIGQYRPHAYTKSTKEHGNWHPSYWFFYIFWYWPYLRWTSLVAILAHASQPLWWLFFAQITWVSCGLVLCWLVLKCVLSFCAGSRLKDKKKGIQETKKTKETKTPLQEGERGKYWASGCSPTTGTGVSGFITGTSGLTGVGVNFLGNWSGNLADMHS